MGSRDAWHSRTASGGIYPLGHSGHVALSHGIRRVDSASALGTRGTSRTASEGLSRLRHSGIRRVALGVGFRDTWHAPKGSLGVAFGTRGTLRRTSEGVSWCGFWDTWHAPKEIRRGLSVWLSGHVAYPECSRGDSPGWSSRDTWRTRNALGGTLPAGVTRVVGSKMDGSDSIGKFGPGRVEIGPGRMFRLISGTYV